MKRVEYHPNKVINDFWTTFILGIFVGLILATVLIRFVA